MKIGRLLASRIKPYLKEILEFVLIKSLKKATSEQGLKNLLLKLEQIVPDISNQYSTFKINTPYLKTKTRGLHAFQISLINKAMETIKNPVIVDIGDSAGTHLQYIIGLYSNSKNIKCLSVNCDMKAVQRIREKKLNAMCARAEDIQHYNENVDIFLCFETLEHLMNPCVFLHELSTKTNAKFLIVTVPYIRNSRVCLRHISNNNKEYVNAENTHIFELNPGDWKLIAKHSGWDIAEERIYLQYPKKSIFRISKSFWKKYDFEGFYGMILTRDDTWSSRYMDW